MPYRWRKQPVKQAVHNLQRRKKTDGAQKYFEWHALGTGGRVFARGARGVVRSCIRDHRNRAGRKDRRLGRRLCANRADAREHPLRPREGGSAVRKRCPYAHVRGQHRGLGKSWESARQIFRRDSPRHFDGSGKRFGRSCHAGGNRGRRVRRLIRKPWPGCGWWARFSQASKKASSKAGLLTEGRDRETYFLGAIASFAAFATRNFTTVLALI